MKKSELLRQAIAQRKFPEVLYKYREINDYTDDIFKNQQLWFSKPTEFNDPFEFKIKDKGGYIKDDIVEYFSSNGMSLSEASSLASRYVSEPEGLVDLIEGSKEKIFSSRGVLCLSKVPDDILMWSHYSDNHKGFVIGLSIKEDLDFFCTPLNVNYQKDYPSISYLKENKKIVDSCVRTKFISWKYEKEVRIVKPSFGLYTFKKEALSSVIFGCKISEKDKSNILKLLGECDYPNLEVYQSVMSSAKYKIELISI